MLSRNHSLPTNSHKPFSPTFTSIHIQIVEFKWDCFTIQDIVFFKNQNFYSFNLNKNIYLSLFAMLILNRYNLSFFSFFFYNKIQKWDPYSTSSIFLWKIWILRLIWHYIIVLYVTEETEFDYLSAVIDTAPLNEIKNLRSLFFKTGYKKSLLVLIF